MTAFRDTVTLIGVTRVPANFAADMYERGYCLLEIGTGKALQFAWNGHKEEVDALSWDEWVALLRERLELNQFGFLTYMVDSDGTANASMTYVKDGEVVYQYNLMYGLENYMSLN